MEVRVRKADRENNPGAQGETEIEGRSTERDSAEKPRKDRKFRNYK